jgi:hypothetical protein
MVVSSDHSPSRNLSEPLAAPTTASQHMSRMAQLPLDDPIHRCSKPLHLRSQVDPLPLRALCRHC